MTVQAPEAPAATPEPQADGQPAATAPAVPPAPATDTTDWKAEAERWKAQSRSWEDRSKNNHSELTQRDELLRQLAQKSIPFDGKPDPAELTARLEAATTLARQRAVELAIFTSASTAGANASALLDSRAFMAQTAGLDPDAADFTGRVAELVAAAAEDARYKGTPAAGNGQQEPAQPRQQATPPAPSSGAQFGAPTGSKLWTQADYDRATKPGADPEILTKAIGEGLLVNLGIGKPKRHSRR